MASSHSQDYYDIIELIHKEVKPALGCTEPIAVSLAVAKACEALRDREIEPETVEVGVSGNILKNGMGVGVPGTGMVGLNIAAALAMVCGKSQYGLEVLKDLTDKSVEDAKKIVDRKGVSIFHEKTDKKLFISATCHSSDGNHFSKAVVQDNHDSIVYVEVDGKVLLNTCNQASANGNGENTPAKEKATLDYHLTVRKIYDFATTADLEDISFITEGARMNRALAIEGLAHPYGLQVGRTIAAGRHEDVYSSGMLKHCMMMTAAASDARMAGCTLPAMSNSGSGNQGITATMPVVAAVEELGKSEEELTRALILSNLIAIHIKGYLGKLSALCGCVIASTGSACGIVWLRGGGYDNVCYAIKNMIGNITGMVCDGAKVGCAMKVASGVSSAVQSAVLAVDGLCISDQEGIIDSDVEKTIRNLGEIGSKGMQVTDEMILDIMICK